MADKPMARGFLSKLIMGFEREYGVMPVAPKGYDLPFNTFGVSMSKTLTAAGTLRGTRNPQEPIPGRTDVSGDIQVPLDYVCMGYWFRALFGLPETTGGESSGPLPMPSSSTTIWKASGLKRCSPPIPRITF